MIDAPVAEAVHVRQMRRPDARFAGLLHHDVLPHGFYGQLGVRFLREYYGAFIDSPHAIALLAESGGAPVGVVVGARRPREHHRWMVRHRGAKLAVRGVLALLARPEQVRRFLLTRARRYAGALLRVARHRERGGAVASDPPLAVLTHLAVSPCGQRSGTGRSLVEAFAREAARSGAQELHLVTLSGEAGAAGFYRKLGWTEAAGTSTADGVPMTRFRLSLTL